MNKNTHFFGQSVFGQLISLIDNSIIARNSRKCNADHYIKKFTTKDHLISMLFGVFAKCSSLREISGAMLGLSGKTKHFQLESLPYRSTLSDANKRRTSDVFAGIYNDLLKQYHYLFSDSRIKQVIKKQIEIFDSTTISLFQDILKCVSRNPVNGRRKGGIKMHTVMNVDEFVPKMVWFTSAATNDHYLLDKLKFDANTIYVFDKGYNDYVAFKRFCDNHTGFVTRIKDNAVYAVEEELYIDECICLFQSKSIPVFQSKSIPFNLIMQSILISFCGTAKGNQNAFCCFLLFLSSYPHHFLSFFNPIRFSIHVYQVCFVS